jgi:toxin ParE1/3/4
VPGRRLRFREAALADVEAAVRWYAEHAGAVVVDGFLVELEAAYAHITRHPGTGSPRWAHALNIEGLRCWRLSRVEHLVFYVERGDAVEVWRVLHGARDIPATLADADSEGG